EAADRVEQKLLGGFARETNNLRLDPDLAAGPHLVTHIDGRSGIVADHHHHDGWIEPAPFESGGTAGEASPHLWRDRFTVDDLGRHGSTRDFMNSGAPRSFSYPKRTRVQPVFANASVKRCRIAWPSRMGSTRGTSSA